MPAGLFFHRFYFQYNRIVPHHSGSDSRREHGRLISAYHLPHIPVDSHPQRVGRFYHRACPTDLRIHPRSGVCRAAMQPVVEIASPSEGSEIEDDC